MKIEMAVLIVILFLFTSCDILGIGGEPDIPGKIVFSARDGNNTEQIYTMNADGSGVRQLTYLEDDGAFDPSWSPDGRQIVFSTSLRSSSAGFSLYVMDADGSNKRALHEREGSHIPTPGSNPKWSPNGSKIVWHQCVNCQIATNYELFVYDFETDSVTQLTDEYASNRNPSWNPDGSRIVFSTDRDYFDADTLRFRQDLYAVDADGTNLKRLTRTGYARQPIWHPSGASVTFRSTQYPSGLYQVDFQSGEIEEIKRDLSPGVRLFPLTWSPDGRQLLIFSWDANYPRENNLLIWNIEDEELEVIYSRPSYDNSNPFLSGADWFYPAEH